MNTTNKLFSRILVIVLIVPFMFVGTGFVLPLEARAQDAPDATTIRVAPSGSDTSSCGSASAPCQSIQYAANRAVIGDTILVAAGTYYYRSSADTCSFLTTRAVVCFVDKHLTILGGYTTSNWSAPNPTANPTVIDGAASRRGVAIIAYNSTASMRMEGITIQNGVAQGTSSGDDFYTFAFGGGIWAQNSSVTLRNMVFRNNRAIGGNTTAQYGGAGSGGALAIQSAKNGALSTLENVTFEYNQALGGSGSRRGGVAIGGGVFVFNSKFTGTNLKFTSNTAQAGSSSGSGIDSIVGLRADALGGGVGFQELSVVTLHGVVATGNRAIGGNAGSSSGAMGGGGFGGAVSVEASTMTFSGGTLQANTVTGGNGASGGVAFGGGILSDASTTNLDSLKVIGNVAISGATTTGGNAGSPNGGGAYLTSFRGSGYTSQVVNCLFADNGIQLGVPGATIGGGGAGLVVQAIHADILHTTFVRNYFVGNLKVGQALVVHGLYGDSGTPGTANINYSIISDHVNPNTNYTSALTVALGSTASLWKVLFTGNTNDTNLNNAPVYVGTINGMSSTFKTGPVGYVSPGYPSYDYHLVSNSPAIDLGEGSGLQVDFDGQTRPTNAAPDLGADEFELSSVSASPDQINVMLDASTAASRSIEIVIPADPQASWTASTNANWMYLGHAAEQQASGISGDLLNVQFVPGSVGVGVYQANIDITSPGMAPLQIVVTLVRVNTLYNTFLPLTGP